MGLTPQTQTDQERPSRNDLIQIANQLEARDDHIGRLLESNRERQDEIERLRKALDAALEPKGDDD